MHVIVIGLVQGPLRRYMTGGPRGGSMTLHTVHTADELNTRIGNPLYSTPRAYLPAYPRVFGIEVFVGAVQVGFSGGPQVNMNRAGAGEAVTLSKTDVAGSLAAEITVRIGV